MLAIKPGNSGLKKVTLNCQPISLACNIWCRHNRPNIKVRMPIRQSLKRNKCIPNQPIQIAPIRIEISNSMLNVITLLAHKPRIYTG